MKLIVVSPPDERADEHEVAVALFAAGLTRYHLRKPAWPVARMASWLAELPPQFRRRVVLHGHHALAQQMGAGGIHFRDDGTAPKELRSEASSIGFVSRACHDLADVVASLAHYNAVLFAPVFGSLSKPGHGPMSPQLRDELAELLRSRTSRQRTTEVVALGGVTSDRLAECHALGFDGAAVLGAVWAATNPVAAFAHLDQVSTALAAIPERKSSS